MKFALVLLGVIWISSNLAWSQSASVDPGAIPQEFEPELEGASTGSPVLEAPLLPGAPTGAQDVSFILNALRIEGASVFSDDELAEFAEPLIGKEVSLADIYQVSVRITQFYSEAGYPLSIAVVPAQEIENGEVKIAVYEGYVAEIEITGDPGRARNMLNRIGEKLKKEQPLTRAALERYLLLANDLPGLIVRGVFDKAPDARGGVKLILDATPSRFNGSLAINNRGSKAIGRERAVLSLGQDGALTGRESMSLDYIQTFDQDELSFVQFRNSLLLTAEGTTLHLEGSVFESQPGTDILRDAEFESDGWSVSVGLQHPFVRSRSKNVRGFLRFEANEFESRLLDTLNTDDRLRVFRAGLIYDSLDETGASLASVSVNKGVDVFNATNDPATASRANGSAEFASVNLDLSRRHALGNGFEVQVSGSGQAAFDGLLSSEECGYGGGRFGRGFDNFEISGDHCALGSVELRKTFYGQSAVSAIQPFVFVDAGAVWQRGSLLAGEDRQETASSAGAGLRMSFADRVSASLEYAVPFERDVALEGNRDGRVFFSVTIKP